MAKAFFKALWVLLFLCSFSSAYADRLALLNASYDPTREFYQDYNAMFQKHWNAKTGQDIVIRQSHSGSGKQARAVIDGLPADIVTLALAYDIDVIARHRNLLPENWQRLLPNNSAPYTSTIVFLVRKGNPKQIKDWNDLVRDGVEVITPNPKTSGGARWNYMAAYAYAHQSFAGDETKITDFIRKLFNNVPVLDAGARGSTTTFIQREIGDVLLSWENEAYLAVHELGKDKFDIVVPPSSIVAEPPVAVVEKNAQRRKTLAAAQEYLSYLYSKEAQELAVKHYYRPYDKNLAAQYKNRFPQMKFSTIDDFGGWKAVQKKHFDDGGLFDQLSKQ